MKENVNGCFFSEHSVDDKKSEFLITLICLQSRLAAYTHASRHETHIIEPLKTEVVHIPDIDLSLGRPPNDQWKRRPGRPRERWIDREWDVMWVSCREAWVYAASLLCRHISVIKKSDFLSSISGIWTTSVFEGSIMWIASYTCYLSSG